MPSLRRLRDNAGDAGSRVECYKIVDGKLVLTKHSKPTVGECILVGSLGARTYSAQDYWRTTRVAKILSKKKGCIRFLTENGSEYEFKY